MIEQKIRQSLVVDRVIPEYVRDEFPRFAEFIREYYRWMDSDNNTNDMLAKFLANKDIQTATSDDHAFFILNTFLSSIPKTLEVDYKLLIQNIKSFYSEKGTEASIKSFFYLISEARKPNSIVIEYNGFEDLLVGLEVYGVNSGAKAVILNAVRIAPASSYVTLQVQYSTEAAFRGRFFTSVDEVLINGVSYRIAVEDFNVNVFYPKDYILRASDGEYAREYRCRIKFPSGDYIDYTNQSFTSSSGSIGRVQRQSSIVGSRNGSDYYELVLNFTKPTVWTLNEVLYIGDSEIFPVPVLSQIEVQDGGLKYQVGDTFRIIDETGTQLGNAIVKTTCKCRVKYYDINNGGSGYQLYDRFQLKYSDGFYGTGYVSEVVAGIIRKIHLEFTRDGSGEYPEVVFDSGNQSADIYLYGDQIGAVKTVEIDDIGFDVGVDAFVEVPAKPFPLRAASLQITRNTLYRTPLSAKSERGTLSSYYRLQDSFYWQDYSYVLQFNRSFNFNEHFDLFKKTVHPAGTKAFFEYRRAGTGAPDLDVRTNWSQFIKLQQEKISSKTIGDIAYDTIEDHDRIKDVSPLLTYVFPGYVRENNKYAVFDNHLYFPYVGMTVAELDDFVTLHKYTCTIDVHPVYVQITS